jgi:hypothetical protein
MVLASLPHRHTAQPGGQMMWTHPRQRGWGFCLCLCVFVCDPNSLNLSDIMTICSAAW